MGSVTITKAKPKAPKTKSVGKTVQSHEAELADIIIQTNAALEAAKQPRKEQNAAKKELLEIVEKQAGPDDVVTIEGKLGIVKFGQASNKRVLIDAKAVHKMLGDETFYALASVSLTDLDKYLTEEQRKQVLDTERGSRGMDVLPKKG